MTSLLRNRKETRKEVPKIVVSTLLSPAWQDESCDVKKGSSAWERKPEPYPAKTLRGNHGAHAALSDVS